MADFDAALAYALQSEGGYAEPPEVEQPTYKGIAQKAARAWGYTGAMRDFPDDEVAGFYKDNYWDNWNLDEITDDGIATAIFNLHINTNAAPIIQAAVADCGVDILQDGFWGPATREAVDACDPAQLLSAISQSGTHYQELVANNPSAYSQYLNGWVNRAEALADLAVSTITKNPVASSGIGLLLLAGIGFLSSAGRGEHASLTLPHIPTITINSTADQSKTALQWMAKLMDQFKVDPAIVALAAPLQPRHDARARRTKPKRLHPGSRKTLLISRTRRGSSTSKIPELP